MPGGGKAKEALSRTSTQSPEEGGVKVCVPVVANVPICVVTPVDGLYHQAIMVGPAIEDPPMVTERDVGRYAMMEDPSLAYAVVA